MTNTPKADFTLNLTWQGGQRFSGTSDGGVSMAMDGKRETAPSPPQAVAFAEAQGFPLVTVEDLVAWRSAPEGVPELLRA